MGQKGGDGSGEGGGKDERGRKGGKDGRGEGNKCLYSYK